MTTVDLHGCSVAEALTLFVDHYNRQLGAGDTSSIKVIHGYGSTGEGGKIRTALLKALTAYADYLSFQTDPINPGATLVHPVKKLPDGAGIIAPELVAFCSDGKSESKIIGRFRSHGDLNVRNALKQLVKQGRLAVTRKGRHTIYRSV